MKKSKTMQILISTFIILIIIAISVTYAFFTADISGTELESTISIGGAEMTIAYNDSNPEIVLENLYPKDEIIATKSFTLTGINTTSFDMVYQIVLKVEENGFSTGAIKYDMTSTNTSENGEVVPSMGQTDLKTGTNDIVIGVGRFLTGNSVVHTYSMNFYFPKTNTNQNAEQGKKLKARIILTGQKEDVSDSLLIMNASINNLKLTAVARDSINPITEYAVTYNEEISNVSNKNKSVKSSFLNKNKTKYEVVKLGNTPINWIEVEQQNTLNISTDILDYDARIWVKNSLGVIKYRDLTPYSDLVVNPNGGTWETLQSLKHII